MATTTEAPQETEQERKVREEEEEHERQLEAEREADAKAHDEQKEPPEGHLIDPEEYETEALALPKIDGEGVDKLRAKFAGSILLDRSDERDVALIRDTKLGSRITLMVECEVGPPVPDYTTNRDGDLDALVLGRTFKVENVYRATVPES